MNRLSHFVVAHALPQPGFINCVAAQDDGMTEKRNQFEKWITSIAEIDVSPVVGHYGSATLFRTSCGIIPDIPMAKTNSAAENLSPGRSMARDLVTRIDDVLQNSATTGQPLELDPHRAQLFELFVMAEATGFLEEGAEVDLTCDGVARELAGRWNLAGSVGSEQFQPSALPPEHLKRLRLIWSFMRMWMDWTYAWQRWNEFHQHSSPSRTAGGP